MFLMGSCSAIVSGRLGEGRTKVETELTGIGSVSVSWSEEPSWAKLGGPRSSLLVFPELNTWPMLTMKHEPQYLEDR